MRDYVPRANEWLLQLSVYISLLRNILAWGIFDTVRSCWGVI